MTKTEMMTAAAAVLLVALTAPVGPASADAASDRVERAIVEGNVDFDGIGLTRTEVRSLLRDLSQADARRLDRSCLTIARNPGAYAVNFVAFCDYYRDAVKDAEDLEGRPGMFGLILS